MTLATTITVLATCLICEAFFSGAELALISADKVALRYRAEASPRGHLIIAFLAEPGLLISTALVGTNICVVLSSVVATLSLLPRFPHQAELISLALMTPLVLVIGEIVPKSIFQHHADRLAPPLIYILSGFRLLFYPAVAVGHALSKSLLRLLGTEHHRTIMTREELRLLITLPSRAGEDRITAEEQQMISRIFEFGTTTVEDVMLPLSEVTALPVQASLKDVATVIAQKQHTRIPLYAERVDQIEGIVHAFDVLRSSPLAELRSLCRPAIFVPRSQPAEDALLQLQREGHGMAVVVDEYGGAIGVVTIEDILEEIVGEIEDEYDAEEADLIRAEGGGAFLVKGRATVEQVNAVTGAHLPLDDDYETMAGLLLDKLKKIPQVGQQISLVGMVITVIDATDRSVEEVRIVRGKSLR